MNNYSRVLLNHKNKISQKFKPKDNEHLGIDIIGDNGKNDNSGYLDKIVAHSNGEVVGVERSIRGYKSGSYGNYVKLKHENGYFTLYAHLEYGSVHAKIGDRLIEGEILGNMGNTGFSKGAHLHFEVRDSNNMKIDPTPFINADLPSLNNENQENENQNDVDSNNDINEILAKENLSDNELLLIVKKTIRGDFGDGNDRKICLGKHYKRVQKQVGKNYNHNTTRWDNVRLYD